MRFALNILFVSSLCFMGCSKDPGVDEHDHNHDHNPTSETGSVKVSFTHFFDNDTLKLNAGSYTNVAGNLLLISKFNYYISNVKLTATDNSVYTESNSYHLVDAGTIATHSFILTSVPVKNYTSISFMIGVDSTRNVSGAQTGDLDPLKGNFWDWNSGYIMAKFEGSHKGTPVFYHVGGYSGVNNPLKTVSILLPNTANVSTSVIPAIKFKSNLAEWFKSPNTVNVGQLTIVHMPGADAKIIADNYADMFTVLQVSN